MYIVIEGPIGAGKTSLARILAEHLGASCNLEVVEENPFLARFYQDQTRFAFPTQVFFLLSRFKQLEALVQENLFASRVVGDYFFEKDFIFASLTLRDSEFALYQDLYDQLRPRLRTPDLTVWLRAEPGILQARIKKRGRSFESNIDSNYLGQLNQHYEDFFRTYQPKLLTLEAAQFDFVERLDDRERVLQLVLNSLGPART